MNIKSKNIGSIHARYLLILLLMGILVLSFLYAAGWFGKRGTSAQQFIDLQENGQPYFSFRRAHAKGICIKGQLVASGLLAPYTRTEFFQAAVTSSFIGRFSIAGANPLAPDLAAPVRSLALSFASDSGERWRTAMNTPTVMPVANPEDLYRLFQVLTPDPNTGKPDRDKISAFFATHPETGAFNQWQQSYRPTRSFATERYHSINAFYLIDSLGQRQAVRWAMVPQANPQLMPADITESEPNALQLEISQRVAAEPVRFDLMVTLANVGDDENNPTVAWADDHQTINAGTLLITGTQPQANGACNGINFNPLVLPAGMAPSKDPILHARSGAYAESYRRRARETRLEQAPIGAQP